VNYTVDITLNYNEIGVGTGSITRTVKADISNVKPESSNVGGGRQEDTISGNIILNNRTGDYDAFAVYLNDSAYYVHEEDYSYDLWVNGSQYTTNKIRLINNNIDGKRLVFKLFDNVISEYTNLLANWDIEYNVLPDTSYTAADETDYFDFRELYTIPTPGTDTQSLVNLEAVKNYVDVKVNEFTYKIPYTFVFVNTTGTNYNITIGYKQFRAIGYKNDTTNETPAGIDWEYDSDVSGQPRFIKAPKYRSADYSGFIPGFGGTVNIVIEQEADIEYQTVVRDFQTIIEYLIDKADSSIGIDSNTFDGLDNVVGAGTGIYGTDKFAANLKLMTVSDFIPTLAGNQKNNIATKGMLSLAVIFQVLEQMGFYWYLEESGGTYYFRINHITLKTLGSSNPSIDEYNSRDIKIVEDIYNKVTNSSVSGDYNFSMPSFIFREGTKSVSWGSQRIFTNIDHIIDGKDSVCDQTSGEQWVLIANGNDNVREFTSDLNSISTNNYELSFYWVTKNLIEVPGKIDKDGNSYDDSRLQKKKTVTLDIKLDNPQEDYTFYDSVGDGSEIQNLRKDKITDSIGQMIIKFK
jgi:hypothetical protein